jgi:hypothetical protein
MADAQGLSHIIYSARRTIRVKRDEFVRRGVRKLAPWIEQTDMIQARNLVQLEWIQRRLFEEVRVDIKDAEGNIRPAVDQLRRNALAQSRIAESLGLTPATRQALKSSTANVALDLAAMMAQPPDETEALMTQPMDEKETAGPKAKAPDGESNE